MTRMTLPSGGVEDEYELEVPRELEAGAYADRLAAWFTPHQLVLDFGTSSTVEALIATARVRIPASASLDVVQSLQECIRGYELDFGEIWRPRERGEE